MSWVRFRVGRGTLKIKPRSQMRSVETERKVPLLNCGFFIISWWSDAVQQRYEGGHWAYRLPDDGEGEAFTPPSAQKPVAGEVKMHVPPPVVPRTIEKVGADRGSL